MDRKHADFTSACGGRWCWCRRPIPLARGCWGIGFTIQTSARLWKRSQIELNFCDRGFANGGDHIHLRLASQGTRGWILSMQVWYPVCGAVGVDMAIYVGECVSASILQHGALYPIKVRGNDQTATSKGLIVGLPTEGILFVYGFKSNRP
jgi:hypothetical protein